MSKKKWIAVVGVCAAAAVVIIALIVNLQEEGAPPGYPAGSTQTVSSEVSAPVTEESPIQGETMQPDASSKTSQSEEERSSSPPVTQKDSVEYGDGGSIKYRYYDLDSHSYQQSSSAPETEDAQTLESGLAVVANDLFGMELETSPLKPNSITLTNGRLTIDFSSALLNANLGSAGESILLDAISDLYLNNLDGVNAIYFTIDGGDFITDNIELFRNEPYRTK